MTRTAESRKPLARRSILTPAENAMGDPIYDARWFAELFHPYMNRYTKEVRTEPPFSWITVDTRLSMDLLQKALNGQITLGWYSTYRTPVLGIDIDDHRTGGWTLNRLHPLPGLREQYEAVIRSFPVQPSLVAKSPHGTHVYFLLTERIHVDNLHWLARQALEGVHPELKPTPHTSLRIPALKRFRHPHSLRQMKEWLHDGVPWERLPRYEIRELFGTDWRKHLPAPGRGRHPVTLIHNPSGPATTKRSRLPDLAEVETRVLPFSDGETYEQTFLLAMACRRTGMGVQETIERALWWLEHSTLYGGGMRANPEELEERIRHIFKVERGERMIPAADLSPFAPILEEIVRQHPFVPQRSQAVRRFLENLIRLKLYHDEIWTDESMLLRYDDKYPFYRLNRSRGVYPLPSNLLKKWNTNYPSILVWLLRIGVLTDPGTSFSPSQKVCKYYYINIPAAAHDTEPGG